jgi:glycosyltransferase involved in cell wall biosynthesis
LALESVLAQTEQRLELIIVDDGSTDGTAQFLTEAAARDPRIRVVRLPTPLGAAAARNEGIRLSTGEWVGFLDDDDRWLPTKLEKQLRELRAHPMAVAASCGYFRVSSTEKRKPVMISASVTLPRLLEDNALGSASFCLSSAHSLRRISGFDVKLRSAQDMDLWVRLHQQGEIVVCREPLVLYTVHSGPRITTNVFSQYAGARRFYFKHRHLMDNVLKRHRIAHISFLMSRQIQRRFLRRMRFLMIAIQHSNRSVAFAYARSSLPRILRDTVVR